MIRILEPYFLFEDERGYLKGLINFGRWSEINLIYSGAKTIRGNHYHKETEEVFIILEGKIKVILYEVCDNIININSKKEFIFEKEQAFLIEKNVLHVFEILEDAKWINILSKKTDSKKPDFYKITVKEE
jgi:dTDP-4-dehydrorhamnose 3,5-epimerase-like enzyme